MRLGRNYSNLNDTRRGIMICAWKKEITLCVMQFIDLTGLLCWVKVKKYSPFRFLDGLVGLPVPTAPTYAPHCHPWIGGQTPPE